MPRRFGRSGWSLANALIALAVSETNVASWVDRINLVHTMEVSYSTFSIGIST
jgi:hypothetical protein